MVSGAYTWFDARHDRKDSYRVGCTMEKGMVTLAVHMHFGENGEMQDSPIGLMKRFSSLCRHVLVLCRVCFIMQLNLPLDSTHPWATKGRLVCTFCIFRL